MKRWGSELSEEGLKRKADMAQAMEDVGRPPPGGNGSIMCPACEGRLEFSASPVNGHVHAMCETPGCLWWME